MGNKFLEKKSFNLYPWPSLWENPFRWLTFTCFFGLHILFIGKPREDDSCIVLSYLMKLTLFCLWFCRKKILGEVQSSERNKLPSCKSVLVLGKYLHTIPLPLSVAHFLLLSLCLPFISLLHFLFHSHFLSINLYSLSQFFLLSSLLWLSFGLLLINFLCLLLFFLGGGGVLWWLWVRWWWVFFVVVVLFVQIVVRSNEVLLCWSGNISMDLLWLWERY